MSTPEANMGHADDDARELAYLRTIETEYRTTVAVVAVLTERYLEQSGERDVLITDDELSRAPDLIALRDPSRRRLRLAIAR